MLIFSPMMSSSDKNSFPKDFQVQVRTTAYLPDRMNPLQRSMISRNVEVSTVQIAKEDISESCSDGGGLASGYSSWSGYRDWGAGSLLSSDIGLHICLVTG